MIFPSKLKKGNVIGTTAVSMGCVDENDILRLENAYKNFEKYGYKYKETANVRHNEKFVSSSAKERAEQFMELWEDKDVKLIVATSGGEFLIEILPFLDLERIKKAGPKWFEGYSDPSLINYILTVFCDIATVNGANIKSFGMEKLHSTLINTIKFWSSEDSNFLQSSFELFEAEKPENQVPLAGYNLTEKVEYKALYPNLSNKVSGRLFGGCLDVLNGIFGTEYDKTVEFCKKFPEGMLWYLDNCELGIASLYRTLWKMKRAGWFENANGFLIGRTPVAKEYWDYTYEDALHNALDDLNIPVFYDLDIGHVAPQWAVINCSFGEFTFEKGKGRLLQKMI